MFKKKDKEKKRTTLGSRLITTFNIVLILSILGIGGYPRISDAWNRYVANQMVSNYSDAIENMDPSEIEEAKEAALEYNKALYAAGDNHISEYTARAKDSNVIDDNGVALAKAEDEYYESVMNIAGDSIMGVINIPKINVDLPIYHYTSVDVLEKGIGHLYGSSVPFGGESSHSVVSGHRGLPTMRLFTDLDQLVIGDTFEMNVLNEKHVYKIVEINTVLPEDLDTLSIQKGRDLVTLVTCTPYAVNTHRLLITGERVKNDEPVVVEKTTVQHVQEVVERPTLMLGGIAFIVIMAFILLIHTWIKK